MIVTKIFEEAEKIAMQKSAEQLKSIEIVKRLRGTNFIVCDKGGDDRKCHDNFVMLITNFESPFEIYSLTLKCSSEIIESFPTKELADAHYTEKSYRRNIMKNYDSDGNIVRKLNFKNQ